MFVPYDTILYSIALFAVHAQDIKGNPTKESSRQFTNEEWNFPKGLPFLSQNFLKFGNQWHAIDPVDPVDSEERIPFKPTDKPSVEDPAYCKVMDCSKTDSKNFCPVTCAKYKPVKDEPDWCKLMDCTRSETLIRCPNTCSTPYSEPGWCKFADCTNPETSKSCEKTCRIRDQTYSQSEKQTTEAATISDEMNEKLPTALPLKNKIERQFNVSKLIKVLKEHQHADVTHFENADNSHTKTLPQSHLITSQLDNEHHKEDQQYNDFDDLLYTYDYNYEDDDAIETTSDNLWADGSNNIETIVANYHIDAEKKDSILPRNDISLDSYLDVESQSNGVGLCPESCKSCNDLPGRDGPCTGWCSRFNWCGDSNDHVYGGTDCRGCGDGNIDLSRDSQQYDYKTANRRLSGRQLGILPLILVVLIGVAGAIWVQMVSILPGAFIFPFVGRAFPSIVSYFPELIYELESYLL